MPDKKEYTLDDLESIMQEFGAKPKKQPSVTTDTISLGKRPAQKSDTIRLDQVGRPADSMGDTKPLPDLDGDVRIYKPGKAAPKAEKPQPEKTKQPAPQQENNLTHLQAGMFLNGAILLAATAATVFYSLVDEAQRPLLVIWQLLSVVLAAVVGWKRMKEGFHALLKKKITPESWLLVSLTVCVLDGIVCLGGQRLPFGAVFALQMLMSQWAAYQRQQGRQSRLETLREATKLTAVVKTEDYFNGLPAYQSAAATAEDFSETDRQEAPPEKIFSRYLLGVAIFAAVLALATGLLHGVDAALQALSAAVLVALPASAFVAVVRPMAVLEKRLSKLGTVLRCPEDASLVEKQGFFPLTVKDLFPGDGAKLNGVRFYGGMTPDTVVAYTAALTTADGGSLAAPFEQLRANRNARVCKVEKFTGYPGGIGGYVEGIEVLVGTLEFMEEAGIELPEGTRLHQAVFTAINGVLSSVFVVTYNRSKSAAAGLRTLCESKNILPILVDCDFMLTEPFLREKLGINPRRVLFPNGQTRLFLAERRPPKSAKVIALTSRSGLAQRAYAITGSAMLHRSWRAGLLIHLLGGILGLVAVAVLALTAGGFLLAPYNLLLYGCVWMVPGLLVAEWTRHI